MMMRGGTSGESRYEESRYELHKSYVSDWFRPSKSQAFAQELVMGDLIEFQRHGYEHWALYLGQLFVVNDDVAMSDNDLGLVIHHNNDTANSSSVLTGSTSMSSAPSEEAGGGISIDTLRSVWTTSKARINNDYDRRKPPLPIAEVLARARHMHETSVVQRGYCVLTNNCEHLVHFLRNGRSVSKQVDEFVVGGLITIGAVIVALIKNAIQR